MPILVFSIVQLVFILSLVFIRLTGGFENLFNGILFATAINSLILVFMAHPIFKELANKLNQYQTLMIKMQYTLHLVMLIFLILGQLYKFQYSHLLLFVVFIPVFFLSAIFTWRSCYKLFGSKLYKLFVQGSTMLFIWSILLILLGLFYREDFLTDKLHLMITIYFTLHFAGLGFVLLKIKHDMKSH